MSKLPARQQRRVIGELAQRTRDPIADQTGRDKTQQHCNASDQQICEQLPAQRRQRCRGRHADVDKPGNGACRGKSGKTRDPVPVYTHLALGDMRAVYETMQPEALADQAARVVEQGYRALKVVFIPYTHYTASLRAADPWRNASCMNRCAASSTDMAPVCTPMATASRVTRMRASTHTPMV